VTAPELAIESTREEFGGLWSLYLWIGSGIAVLVVAAVAFALLRYRARSGRRPSERSEAHGLEALVAIAILAIVALLVARTFETEAREDEAPAAATRVDVTAFRWGWRFDYPGAGVSVIGNATRPPTFAVPAGEPVHFSLRSRDVIHAFWVPAERFKRDAIPGRVNEFDLVFEGTGGEEGVCAEFCGLEHSKMGFDVYVLSEKSYRRWLAAHR
jgi:cytochrome c oxidase subunit II